MFVLRCLHERFILYSFKVVISATLPTPTTPASYSSAQMKQFISENIKVAYKMMCLFIAYGKIIGHERFSYMYLRALA